MGRVKLEIKYQENSRVRSLTYITRMKGVKKKVAELSVLCGVDVLVASFSPDINVVQCWPEQNTVEFRRIRERYIQSRRSEKRREGSYVKNQNISSPFPLIQEEMVAIDIKLAEVRERLSFLQASSSNEEQPLQAMVSYQREVQGKVPSSFPSLDQSSPFGQSLPFPAESSPFGQTLSFPAEFSPFGQSLFFPAESSPFGQPLSFPTESSPFGQPLPFSADFTMDLSDSPFWSFVEDWNCCNSLVDYDHS